MTKLQHKHAGIVLAAGASSRMGQPKALLRTPSGKPLALHQAALLIEAGVSDAVIVVGHGVDSVTPPLEDAGARIAFNPLWERGRVSSLQTGISSVDSVHGVLVLPVDTVGVKAATLAAVLAAADQSQALALRPVWQKKSGRILWISQALFEEILGIEPDPNFRLDDWIKAKETRLEVDDPAILNNVNTMEEWEKLMTQHSTFNIQPPTSK